MKRHFFFIFFLLLIQPMFSQAPQGINYQAVIRSNTGNLQINQSLSVRFSIEDGTTNIYQELHTTSSNGLGLVNLVIGKGTPLNGTFSTVPWSQGPYFLKVEVDNGSGFQSLGSTELVSVPFALYAESAGTIENMVLTDLDDVPNQAPLVNQTLKWNGTGWVPQDDQVDDADADPTNEIQTLTLSGSNLSLSGGGGSIALPAGTSYTAGIGIDISGTNISNTGDIDATDDILIGTAAGGDLSGTYPDPSVTALNGQPVASTAPSAGQILKWNGTQWAAATDDSGSSLWSQGGTEIYYNGGDVGIGTTTPDAKMEIYQNSSLSDPHILLHENGNDYARLNFANNNGSNYWSIASYIASNHRNDRLNFWNGVGGDVMTITGDGEVGIGVGISPKVPFHVGNGRRVLFGIDTLGNGDKLMFLPDLHAFRVGTVATGAASTYWNRDSIGLYSFASGLNTRAQGYGATAMGRDTEATNSYAHATGYFSNADGLYSTAMGFNTDALASYSTAMGGSTDALGNYSTSMGLQTKAEAYVATAIGRYNVGGGNGTSWVSTDPIFEVGIGTNSSNRANAMTVRKNGNVGIGTTAPQDLLHVNGRIRLQTVEYIEDGGTNLITARGSLTPSADNTYDLGTANLRYDDVFATSGVVNTSDMRDKKEITPIPYGLSEVMKLNPVIYSWKDRPEAGPKLGLIAQELLPLIKEVVKTHDFKVSEEDESLTKVKLDRLGVYYADLIPVLIKATQEQQEIIDKQQLLIQKLEERLSALEN